MDSVKCITKSCIKCNQDKPLTEFYPHPGTKDGYLTVCKVCKRAQQKGATKHPKDQAVNAGEKMVIEKLRSVGIDAIPGKMSEWKHQDVAAGVVRIEVKKAKLKATGKYLFKFDSQTRNGMNSHVIILICDDGIEPTFHVFPSDHAVFFKHNSLKRKTGVQYQPFAKHRKVDSSMTLELMTAHRDKWNEVEIARQRIERIAA